jgi:hypothetical protein
MAEPEVATKAPENDAVEAPPSVFPGDTPAQTGASTGLGVSRSYFERFGALLTSSSPIVRRTDQLVSISKF